MCWCACCVDVRLKGANVSGRTERHDAKSGREKANPAPIAWLGIEYSECETGPRRGARLAAWRSCPGASICRARIPGCPERPPALVLAGLCSPLEWQDPGID